MGGGESGEYGWDPDRYYHGRVAHFALFNSSMTSIQVNGLLESYQEKYGIPPPAEWRERSSSSNSSGGASGLSTGVLVAIICSSVVALLVLVLVVRMFQKKRGNEKEEFYADGDRSLNSFQ